MPEEGKLLLLGVSDGAGQLDVDEVRRSLDVEKVRIENEILRCVLADDHEAVAGRRLQDPDNPLVHDVTYSGAILGGFSLSQIDTCKRHKNLLGLSLSGPPNASVHPPGPLERRGVARNKNTASVGVQRLVRRRPNTAGH